MDLRPVNKQISEAINRVETLINLTEEVYGSIHLQLPAIEREVESTAKEMTFLLDYFITAGKSSHEDSLAGDQNLSSVLRQVADNFTATIENLKEQSELSQLADYFLATDQKDELGLVRLLEMIEKIKESIAQVEIISVNAMIYAARLGNEGRAFGVISDNIMQLCNQINQQYGQLHGHIQALANWNKDFTGNLKLLLQYHDNLTTKQVKEFQGLFSLVFASLDKVNFLLKDLTVNVEKAVSPIQELMVSIQAQDIIRQNMENLVKCLKTVQDNLAKLGDHREDHQHTLNILSFASGVIQISIKLVDNISKTTGESLADLGTPLTTICGNLQQLQEEGSVLTDFLGGTREGTEKNAVQEIFSQVQYFIEHITNNLQELSREIDGFANAGQHFYQTITPISSGIEAIKERINFLGKLKLMTFIELARIRLEGSSFGQELARISDQVIGEVANNQSLIAQLKVKFQGDLDQFEKVLSLAKGEISSMLQVIAESREKLRMIENLISQAVQGLGGSAAHLMGELEGITGKIQQGAQVPLALHQLKADLLLADQAITGSKEQVLKAAGLKHWENTSEELQEILGHFTTYLERLIASELLGEVEVDVGGEAGELTLF